jgi:hypothetical protein
MSIFSWGKAGDKAIDIVKESAATGMKMWDEKSFSPQEQIQSFQKLVELTKSTATSISRRYIAYSVIAMIAYCLIVGSIWIALGADDMVNNLIELVIALKIGWAFTSAVSFYFLTHVFGKLTKK